MNYSFSAGIRFELCMETRNINNRERFFVLPPLQMFEGLSGKKKKTLNASCMYIFHFIFRFCDLVQRRMFFQVWTWEADFICVVGLSNQWFVFLKKEERGGGILLLLLFPIITNALVEKHLTSQGNNSILTFLLLFFFYKTLLFLFFL